MYSPGLSNGGIAKNHIVYKGYLFLWDNAKTLQIKTPTFFKTPLKCSDEIKRVWFKRCFYFMNLLISTPSSDIRPASNLGAAMGDNSTFTRRIPSFGLRSDHVKKFTIAPDYHSWEMLTWKGEVQSQWHSLAQEPWSFPMSPDYNECNDFDLISR